MERRLQVVLSGQKPYRIAYDELEPWVLSLDPNARMCRSSEGIGIVFSHSIDATAAGVTVPLGYRAKLWR